ncbi:MAG TPA: NAD(P)H-dependent oxidoreductase [Dermatophilaceae bacterium]|nr:NAD(P)H-dependent oxidoreductase [Dermatophilaceae bacterium]
MTRIGIIVGSTRSSRVGDQVGAWVHGVASQRTDAEFELIDLATFALPVLDEPQMASTGVYEHEHTQRWSAAVGACDGYVFVTAEYNHGVPGALKNAFDFLYREWANKAVGFVSYGAEGGVRAVESWRVIVANAHLADVRGAVHLRRYGGEFRQDVFTPEAHRAKELSALLDQVIAWTRALAVLRDPAG